MPRVLVPARKVRSEPAAVPRAAAEAAEWPGVRECFEWFSRERQWINERHLELCRVPAPTFFEQKRAEWMAEQFSQLGYEVRLDRAGNVVALQPAGRDAPLIALTAHLDTVLAPRRPEEISVGADGRFNGPGVADNGAGLAALLAVAKAAASSPPAEAPLAALALIANVGEEGEGNLSGMRYLCRPSGLAGRIKAFVVLDGPANDHITYQALASRRFEVSFTGPGGHSWSDHGMGNPVHALSRAIAAFVDSRTELKSGPRTSFNFGTVEGGLSINSIPTQARAKLDLRSEAPEAMDELVESLSEIVEQAMEAENQRSSGGKVAARVREIGARPGGRLSEDAPLLRCLRAVDSLLGIRAALDCASTDANIPLSQGMAAVSIGAGGTGGGAHTPAEWYSPEGRELGLKRILLTLAMLLHDPGGASLGR